MADEPKTQPMPPVAVTVIDTGHPPETTLTSGTKAATPGLVPDLVVTVVGPAMAIGVRFLNAYLTTVVGLVAAGLTSDVIPASDFASLVWKCAGLGFAGAGLGALKDLVTIFGRLEAKFPLLTGSV